MAQHLIPKGEEEKHIEDPDCKCKPVFILDKKSQEMVWVHQHLELEKMFSGFFKM